MFFDIAWTLAGLVVLVIGAEWLVGGASAIALRLGVSPLFIGLTVVAWGTSLPEALVSIFAVTTGRGDVAAGNVIGSNIANICIILGVAATLCPIKVQFQLIKIDTPIMVAATLCGIFFLTDRVISRQEGMILFSLFVFYTLLNIRIAKKEPPEEVLQEFETTIPHPKPGSLWRDLFLIVFGLIGLGYGSSWLVNGASGIARFLGVSEAIIGLTIVAVGTSMPELATSVVAALKKAPDIAIGNVVGSNIANILGILGITGIVHPFAGPGITNFDLGMMLSSTLIVVPLMVTGLKIGRREGLLLLVLYGVYLWVLWPKPV